MNVFQYMARYLDLMGEKLPTGPVVKSRRKHKGHTVIRIENPHVTKDKEKDKYYKEESKMTNENCKRAALVVDVYNDLQDRDPNVEHAINFETLFADDTETEYPLKVIIKKNYWHEKPELTFKGMDDRYPKMVQAVKDYIRKNTNLKEEE